jgi:hypothetical protein
MACPAGHPAGQLRCDQCSCGHGLSLDGQSRGIEIVTPPGPNLDLNGTTQLYKTRTGEPNSYLAIYLPTTMEIERIMTNHKT